jgi:hypothetical protein
MKKIKVMFIIACVVMLTMLSSCDLRTVRTPDLQVKYTTNSTTSSETSETSETAEPRTAPPVFFEEWELNTDPYGSVYLKADETAWVIDEDIHDGLCAMNEPYKDQLSIGAVMLPLDNVSTSTDKISDNMLFLLPDGRCVYFEETDSENGDILLNGKPASEFICPYYEDYEYIYTIPENVVEYEILLNTPLDPAIIPQNITVNVDWNGDGMLDTIRRECANPDWTLEQSIYYTDGATGVITDISDRFVRDDSMYYGGLTDDVLLYRDEKTNSYALIQCFDVCSCDYVIFVYTYDPETIVSYSETGGYFVFEDGNLFVDISSFIFGNGCSIQVPAVFDGKSLILDPGVQEYWWSSAFGVNENDDALSGFDSYTLKDVSVEKQTAEGYEAYTIPAGIAIFPLYYTDDENGEGFLYFLLADGKEYRAAYTYKEGSFQYLFGGIDQEELFWCSWGG